eukprot:sb/3477284/
MMVGRPCQYGLTAHQTDPPKLPGTKPCRCQTFSGGEGDVIISGTIFYRVHNILTLESLGTRQREIWLAWYCFTIFSESTHNYQLIIHYARCFFYYSNQVFSLYDVTHVL